MTRRTNLTPRVMAKMPKKRTTRVLKATQETRWITYRKRMKRT